MARIITFSSDEDMFSFLGENHRRAVEMTTDAQWAMGPGDWFLHMNSGGELVIGCIVGSSDAEDRVHENHPRCHTQLSRLFSSYTGNEGELTGMLRCNMHPITDEQVQVATCRLGLNPQFPVYDRDGKETIRRFK